LRAAPASTLIIQQLKQQSSPLLTSPCESSFCLEIEAGAARNEVDSLKNEQLSARPLPDLRIK
ncbi:MAG TPA: hypothetical protein VJ023_19120, partial [Pyrinomonadaceae bacterium]|nr:hypothetical protein [Pyrinomonadaceae bacterium]